MRTKQIRLKLDGRWTQLTPPQALEAALALHRSGQRELARGVYRTVLRYAPFSSQELQALGAACYGFGDYAEAIEHWAKAAARDPRSADVRSNLGVALSRLGRSQEALSAFEEALAIDPNRAPTHSNYGDLLADLQRYEEAEAHCRRALEIDPRCAEALNNLGRALENLGRPEQAAEAYRGARETKPDFAEAHYNQGIALQNLGQLDDAVASYRRALKIKPDFAEAHSNLGVALKDLGQLDEAVASCRRALEIKPDYAEAHSHLLFFLTLSEAVDAQALFAEHCRFAQQFEEPLRASWPRHGNSRDPERRLQVGFVSGDLRNHAVRRHIEPVWAHLAGCPRLSLHAYYNHAVEDSDTQRLRGYLAHWHSIVRLSDAALAQKIREDGIDILIDLSGHTGHNRLLSFARKPAPVEASWIGYPGTTGLRAMDYYITDRFLLPEEQFASQFTEEFVYLPASVPFMPPQGAPAVNALPALSNGYVTFGSFNRRDKISRSVIALWARLLRALPDSRVLLGGLPEGGKCDELIEWFAQEGITRDHLSFHGRSDMDRLHHQVDICLDTFPYGGATTTLHALWMGVPTLAVAGSTVTGRMGAAILSQVGLEAFVAQDAEDFLRKGLSWTGNLAALSDIRTGLRERFAKSAMDQPALIAERLQHALRIMWQRWCDGLPPVTLDVSNSQ